MIPVTVAKIEQRLQEAKAAGVPETELHELREHLEELKTGRLDSRVEKGEMYKKSKRNGKTVVSVSTAPLTSDDDDFEGVPFKSVA